MFRELIGFEGCIRVFKEGSTTDFTAGIMRKVLLDMEEAYLDLLKVHDGHKLDKNRNLEENVILDSCRMTAEDVRFLHCYRWVGLVS
jgi:hypothetical protein